MVANRAMKKLLETKLTPKEQKIILSIGALQKLFFPPFKFVGDCTILADEPLETLRRGLEQQLDIKNGRDHVWYEADGTERCINDCLSEQVRPELGVRIAFLVAQVWALQLKVLDADAKYCFIVSCDCDEPMVILRFHKIRHNEPRYLCDDLEGYKSEAIGYIETEDKGTVLLS